MNCDISISYKGKTVNNRQQKDTKKLTHSNPCVSKAKLLFKKSPTVKLGISDGTTTPEYSDEYKLLKYDSESNIYELMDATEIRNVLQLSRKSYIYVFEKYFDETLRKTVTKLIMDKTEITKINTRLYSDAYSSLSMITNNRVQLIYNKPVTKDRKFTLKIGKITDIQILQDIKNNKLDGFANLLNFAKNDSSYSFIKNDVLNGKAEYTTDDKNYIDINILENDAYYYVYTLFDDENGNYEKEEAVTLTQASVYPQYNSYYLFLYGSDDFKWTEFNSVKTTVDNTTAPTKIPQTGQNLTVLAITFIFSLIALLGFNFLRKTRGI